LQALGERENGSARPEEAVAARHAVLEEATRDRSPLDWAHDRRNLGDTLWMIGERDTGTNALEKLGERESGTARLDEAVEAYNAALEVYVAVGADYFVTSCRDDRDKALAVLAKRSD
jgi:hypothetical protein